jgi:Skp family chaperone for outer membrane proteins
MNKIKIITIIIIIFLSNTALSKICVIDFRNAIEKEEQAKIAMIKLKNNNNKRRILFETKVTELRNIQALIMPTSLLKNKIKKEKELELQKKSIQLQQLHQQIQEAMESDKIRILSDIEQKNKIITTFVSAKEGCQITLNKEVVIFRDNNTTIDITNQVIVKFNKDYPA